MADNAAAHSVVADILNHEKYILQTTKIDYCKVKNTKWWPHELRLVLYYSPGREDI